MANYTDKELIALKDIHAFITFAMRQQRSYRSIISDLKSDLHYLEGGCFHNLKTSGHALAAAVFSALNSDDINIKGGKLD